MLIQLVLLSLLVAVAARTQSALFQSAVAKLRALPREDFAKLSALAMEKARSAPEFGHMKVGELSGCGLCVQFFGDNLGLLLNIILQVGVATSCEEVCSKLPAGDAQQACGVLCELAGIAGFIYELQHADLDPVWLCAELHVCAHNNCKTNCTEIQSVTVTPAVGAVRSTFHFDVAVKALQNTGVGVAGAVVDCPKCQGGQWGFESVNDGFQAGSVYHIKGSLDTAEEDWLWNDGVHGVEAFDCGYDCGDPEHGVQFSTKKSSFKITGSP